MADERNYYVLCENNCKFPAMTKEQIIAAIAEATGTTAINIDAAFITKLKEQNRGDNIKFWVGTQSEYNALVASGNIDSETFYCTSDGGTIQELCQVTDEMLVDISALNNKAEVTSDRVQDNADDISALEKRVSAVEATAGTISGVIPITKGGTGASSVAGARKNLGLGNTSGALPIANGGTNATTALAARNNLGIYSETLIATFDDYIEFTIDKKANVCVASISGFYYLAISTSGTYYTNYLADRGQDLRVVTECGNDQITIRVWYTGTDAATIKNANVKVSVDVIYIV